MWWVIWGGVGEDGDGRAWGVFLRAIVLCETVWFLSVVLFLDWQ